VSVCACVCVCVCIPMENTLPIFDPCECLCVYRVRVCVYRVRVCVFIPMENALPMFDPLVKSTLIDNPVTFDEGAHSVIQPIQPLAVILVPGRRVSPRTFPVRPPTLKRPLISLVTRHHVFQTPVFSLRELAGLVPTKSSWDRHWKLYIFQPGDV